MCGLAAGLAAVTGIMQYRSQQQAADNQAAMYRAQANAAEQNARVEGRKQEQIADVYAQKASQLKARQKLAEGAQRAQTGAAGMNFSGSAMDILSSGYEAYGQDQANLLTNQRNDNYSSRAAQSQYDAQAANDRTAADNVESQAKMQGIGTILGTAASIYGLSGAGGGSAAPSGGSTSFGNMTANAGYGTNWAYNTTKQASSLVGNGTNWMTGKAFFPKNKFSF